MTTATPDPLDTLTLDLTAKRAFCGEINTYAAWAASEGVEGVRVRDNFYGQQRHMLMVANQEAAIVERRLEAGLRRYETEILDNLRQQFAYNLDLTAVSDVILFGGVFSLDLNPYVNADPVYLLHRQYNTGPFNP